MEDMEPKYAQPASPALPQGGQPRTTCLLKSTYAEGDTRRSLDNSYEAKGKVNIS